ncbi:MAG TPA: SIMPL domain-containing protein [Mycobacteriales bacterium]|nr:SIMPL domain-containing protein [Mycobacteriales bacterium]
MAYIRMHRWPWLVGVAALVAGLLVVTGVGRGGGRAAIAADTVPDDTVAVTGIGTADGTPDTLTVDFTVHVNRGDVQSALDAQAAATRRVLAKLRRDGVDNKHLRTTDLSLYRRYDNHGNPIGYTASNTLEARITPLTHAGRTISDAAATSSHVDVGDLRFDIANDDQLMTQARANAYADAKQRAEQYAALSGRSLGRVEKVNETVRAPEQPQPQVYADALSAGSAGRAAAVPIQAGQQTLLVRVTIIWQLT